MRNEEEITTSEETEVSVLDATPIEETPMTSRPMNYFNLLSLIESPVAQNWMAYAIRYCQGYQFKAGNRKVFYVGI